MTNSNTNTNNSGFRTPPNLRGLVHPDVEQTIYDHDTEIVDLQAANSTVADQIKTLQAQVAALQKSS